MATIASELMEFMASSELCSKHCDVDPATLVGKSIEHKFKLDSSEFEWFRGFVLDYDTKTSLHEVVYEGEEEHCHFNLLEDLYAVGFDNNHKHMAHASNIIIVTYN